MGGKVGLIGKGADRPRRVQRCEAIFKEFSQQRCEHISPLLDKHVPCVLNAHKLPVSPIAPASALAADGLTTRSSIPATTSAGKLRRFHPGRIRDPGRVANPERNLRACCVPNLPSTFIPLRNGGGWRKECFAEAPGAPFRLRTVDRSIERSPVRRAVRILPKVRPGR